MTTSHTEPIAAEKPPEVFAETVSIDNHDPRLVALTPEHRKRVMRRVNLRVVVMLAVIYIISISDRNNLGLAAVAGMTEDLDLKGTRYSVAVLVFFPTYILFQPLATVAIRKIGPRVFLTCICMSWGAILVGIGFVKNWNQLVALRLVLGILESGSFPSSIYLLSSWVTRRETQRRVSYYYMIGIVISAFAGILAFGLMKMDGTAGIRGWRWIFIMEGVITFAIAMVAFWVLVDFPDKATKSFKFLNTEEVEYVVACIEDDRKDVIPEPFSWRDYLSNALDVKIWMYSSLFLLSALPTYGLTYFLPIILRKGLGYSVTKAQCLTAPPQIASGIVMFVESQLGDRYQIRGLWNAINAVLVLIGAPIVGFVKTPGIRLFGVFLASMGAYPQIPAIITYQTTNIRGQWRRAFCSASLVGGSGVGAIAGSLVFRSQDAPSYVPGLIALMVANSLILLLVAILTLSMRRDNKLADNGKKVIEGLDSFRYIL